ncbi:MAG: hypothetical protein IJ151_00600 [Bacteroidales bacterium]|nr:hypothetical protein [Bacteroidales bacterium]
MKKILLTIAAVAMSASALFAQDFQTGYFLNGYTQAYKLNPALRPDKAFISLPVIGGSSVASRSNIGLDNILFPVSDGKLGFFMHPEVSSQQFLSGLKSTNRFTENAQINLLSFGFKTGPLFHTVDVGVRSLGYAKVPYELFAFLKDGVTNRIDIPSVSIGENAFAEVAYGLNLKIGNIVSVGGRIKYLVGIMNGNVSIDDLSVTNNNGVWTVKGSTKGQIALKGASFKTKVSEDGSRVIDDIDFDDFDGTSGNGVALDLGVAVNIIPGLKLSAALCDIGGINWKYNINGKRDSQWVYDGDSDDLGDELTNLLELEDLGSKSEFKMLPATARLGAEFSALPFVTVGLLGTQQLGEMPWTEVRASANFKPFKLLGASVSAATGTFGFSWGAALNLNLKVVNLCIGMDAIPTKYTPQYVPLGAANFGVNFGLNITI